MAKKFYFSIEVSDEQKEYARELVAYSLKHHPVSNIWDKTKKEKTEELRFTGTLGEVVFADTYDLKRPTRSFGAIDGQDYGQDFQLRNGAFDIKTMHRKSNIFYENYVLNIPSRNVNRADSLTDYYFCISLHEKQNTTIASFIGYIKKKNIIEGKTGILYPKGTKRIRKDKTHFTFFEDTYEVFFKDIKNPLVTEKIRQMSSFKVLYLRK